ncbi:MAG: hypothetical protein JXR73_22245 [Candidatus Omnitrophica bacterium]|nr:hypothetical protein [Candidatus Omnitrophota bacterium]
MMKRIILLGLILAALAVLMVHRYGQLRIEFDNARFFRNASVALSLTARGEFNPQAEPIPSEWKTMEENPLPLFHSLYPETKKKALIDPFLPAGLPDRLMQLRYGYVEHDQWTPPKERVFNKPTWFVWGCGPAQVAPEWVESAAGEGERLFRFISSPYDPSNGLRSMGYLYMDQMGGRIGKIR